MASTFKTPAGSFVLDRQALEHVRAQQQELVDGRIWSIGYAELFDLNSSFHEVIIGCSGNTVFVDALQRVDNLRRLIEYRRSLARNRAIIRCREHVVIADLLLTDETDAAAEYMRVHLRTVGKEKVSGEAPPER